MGIDSANRIAAALRDAEKKQDLVDKGEDVLAEDLAIGASRRSRRRVALPAEATVGNLCISEAGNLLDSLRLSCIHRSQASLRR